MTTYTSRSACSLVGYVAVVTGRKKIDASSSMHDLRCNCSLVLQSCLRSSCYRSRHYNRCGVIRLSSHGDCRTSCSGRQIGLYWCGSSVSKIARRASGYARRARQRPPNSCEFISVCYIPLAGPLARVRAKKYFTDLTYVKDKR